jgi:hypothetical protein
MWTGRQTLASIEGAIAKLHGEESQLDVALRSAISDTERLRNERSQGLRELARVKLDEIAAGRLINNLDAGERRALQILNDYRLRIAAAAQQSESLQKEVTAAEAGRHAAAAAVEAALGSVEDLRAAAQAQAQTSQPWRDAKALSDQAEAVAVEAERKAEASEADLGAKKKPYNEDPLFSYLWRRQFGTAHYAGSGIARLLDRRLAEFIGYGNARPNYGALIEIPLRLREHAIGKRKAAEASRTALAEIERRAMVDAGIEAKEETLAEARHTLAVLDDTAEKKREMLRKVDETRKSLVAGNSDPAYNEALTVIAAADAEDSLANLYAESRRTPTHADEAIVERLEAIDGKISKTEAEIADLRRQSLELSRRRSEMEEVRRQFRGTGYDHPQSTFSNDGDLSVVLKNVLEGAVRSGILWDALRQGHGSRPARSSADFGAPSFPFPFPMPGNNGGDPTGGGWRNPSSGGAWMPTPNPARSSNDDFTTGGSF